MPALTTLDAVKTAINKPLSETDQDAKITAALEDATAAIQSYTRRTFEDLTAPETRSFRYDESGIITVDDFQHGSVTAVATRSAGGTPTAVNAGAWWEQPLVSEYPVGWWLEMAAAYPESPEMGFTRNVDVLYREGRLLGAAVTVEITARWGWPPNAVPKDVRRAATWTTIAFLETARAVLAETVGGVSRTYAPAEMAAAIPSRAAALLDPHVKGSD